MLMAARLAHLRQWRNQMTRTMRHAGYAAATAGAKRGKSTRFDAYRRWTRMSTSAHLLVGLSAVLLPFCLASPAPAGNLHSYVSGNGSGTTCSLQAPCLSIHDAIPATDPGGEVSCLDGGASTAAGLEFVIISQDLT